MKRIALSLCMLICCLSLAAQSLVTLKGDKMELAVTTYGARIVSLKAYGLDVVLGYDDLSLYQTTKQNFGAVVGRYIGRIIGGHLEIDGQTYQLDLQSSGDCGHGGDPNFGGRDWEIVATKQNSVSLRYVSPDGEHGFPGELSIYVTYTLLQNGLRIDYAAQTTKPTVLNPSNHSFFNLTGDLSQNVMDEVLWINGDKIALYDENKRVTGKLGDVKGTPFDFTKPHRIGERIDDDDFQLSVTKGYDHCYQLNGYDPKSTEPRLVARLIDNQTKLGMEVFTTEPALQIYTANGHKGDIIGKNGKVYGHRNAICFETMHFPDSPNQPQWPSTLLRPGETFRSTTIYRFGRLK